MSISGTKKTFSFSRKGKKDQRAEENPTPENSSSQKVRTQPNTVNPFDF